VLLVALLWANQTKLPTGVEELVKGVWFYSAITQIPLKVYPMIANCICQCDGISETIEDSEWNRRKSHGSRSLSGASPKLQTM